MSLRFHPLAIILIGLGVVGFVGSLFTDPLGMLKTAAFIAAIVGIFVLLYKRFIKKTAGRGLSAYQRAAKQSAKRYKQQNHRKNRRPSHLKLVNSRPFLSGKRKKSTLERRKKEHNLTVIDGKKRKKKNRALF